ncbi:PQQ-binding-like beta-propeller repeat protein [Micromonospora sp. NPDC048999]|uniref:outer membrane protein assembly factor BamB family protein n=1 Tax=Micromonospora sp. NPDC048999 TaxID=3155391 RepID=UPI0033DC8BE2
MSRVIELGELRHGDEPEPPAPRPRRRPTTSARLVALCCAALLTLTGGTPMPRQLSGVPVPAVRDAIFLVVGDRLVVADRPGTVGDGGRPVRGYGLPSAAPLWQFTLPVGDEVVGMITASGLLLVTSSPDGSDVRTTALDPRTGAERWRQPGSPTPTQAGGVLLDHYARDPGVIRSVDPASGAVRWSLPLPQRGMTYRFEERGVTAAVLLTDDGRVEEYDVDSGALRRSGRLAPAADPVSYGTVQVLGDLLLVDDAAGTVTAYGLDRLDRRWTLPVRWDGTTWFANCVVVICQWEQGRLRTYDPATGRPRWSDDHWVGTGRIGDRLVAVASTDGLAVEVAVLDPGTGRILAELGRWRQTGGNGDGPLPLGLRPVAGDRTLLAELDLLAGQVRYRAVVPGSWGDCAAAADAVVCMGQSGGLMVWPTGS